MEAIIRKLINLQNCDLRLKDIKREKAVGPAKIKAFEDDLKRIEEQVNDELGEVDAMKRERRQIEQQVTEQKDMLENTLESLTHPFYVIDANDYTIKSDLRNAAKRALGIR